MNEVGEKLVKNLLCFRDFCWYVIFFASPCPDLAKCRKKEDTASCGKLQSAIQVNIFEIAPSTAKSQLWRQDWMHHHQLFCFIIRMVILFFLSTFMHQQVCWLGCFQPESLQSFLFYFPPSWSSLFWEPPSITGEAFNLLLISSY